MLLKTTIKLLLVSIWISIFNLLTFLSLEFFQNENFLSLGETAKSLTKFLFANYYNQFDISIIISILAFIFFIVIDYFYEKSSDNKNLSLTKFIITYSEVVFGNIFGFSLLIYLSFFGYIVIPCFFWKLLIEVPYFIGWRFLLNPDYSHYLPYLYYSGGNEFLFRIVLTITFFIILSLCFDNSLTKGNLTEVDEEVSDYGSLTNNSDLPLINKLLLFVLNSPKKIRKYVKNQIKSNKISIRFLFVVYLLYLSPSIFVWLYPVLCNWFGNFNYPTRFLQIVNSYIFLAGLLVVIIQLFINNKKVKRELLKEEIKKEVMEEINLRKEEK